MAEADMVVEFTDRKRNQMWRSPEVLGALDRFAARAGRRGHTTGDHDEQLEVARGLHQASWYLQYL